MLCETLYCVLVILCVHMRSKGLSDRFLFVCGHKVNVILRANRKHFLKVTQSTQSRKRRGSSSLTTEGRASVCIKNINNNWNVHSQLWGDYWSKLGLKHASDSWSLWVYTTAGLDRTALKSQHR